MLYRLKLIGELRQVILFSTSLSWHSKGIATIPTVYRSKKPIVKYKQYKNTLPTLKQLAEWYLGPQCNMAIITTENLVILDFDNPVEYGYWFCYQMANNPDLIDTYMVMTSRGLHLYYWVDEPFEKIKINEPYEVKSHGCLVTIPPSVHQSGIAYRAINSIDDIKKVSSIQQLLTFSILKFDRPKIKLSNDPWQIYQQSAPIARVDLLELFPDARQTDDNYFLTDCPIHGHKNNFWLDTNFNIAGCFSGCGGFLATELMEMMSK